MKRFRHATLAAALAVLAIPTLAEAAPPPNDNRAAAAPIAAFPANLPGSTLEATVERLDPQISECGPVEGTVWYRIDAAPDGLIEVAVQGAGIAPVVRIYQRRPSDIVERDCASAARGGRAAVSFAATRGSAYLVLVGRRPNTSDGEFALTASVFLPPANDRRTGAARIGRPPASVRGSTVGATLDEADAACGIAAGSVWYSLATPAERRIVLRLQAAGELDAAIAVFERQRSELRRVGCAQTDRRGAATLTFTGARGGRYLVLVGQRARSDAGTFTLRVTAAEAPESLPGKALRPAGVHATVHGIADVNDVWWIDLRPGTTYRLVFSSRDCAAAYLYRPRGRSLRDAHALLELECRAYTTFTPGPSEGGRYALEVEAYEAARIQPYALRVAPAGPDDIGIGRELPNGVRVSGSLSPAAADLVDLYHFDVERTADVSAELGQLGGALRLVLVRDNGSRLGETAGELRRRLPPGRYVVAVRASAGGRAARYSLTLLVRNITSTRLLVEGKRSVEVAPGSSVTLAPAVSPTVDGGTVVLRIDRFDPLTGWHFHRLLRISATAGGTTWTPPAPGRWRVAAAYLGTRRSSPSRSGYLHVLVAEPIR